MSETSEGVGEALEALTWISGNICAELDTGEKEEAYYSRLEAVRERLEEVEEDAARYADSNMRLNESYNRLSRRSEKLEGALRTVLNEHRIAEDWSLPKRLEEYLTSALATLDSREDEGDRRCALCNHPISDHPIRAGDSGRIEICTHPVHADQPERGDCPHCSYRGNPDPESPVDEFVHDVDCPNRNPNAAPGDEPEEGDSVWHNRAADECRCGHARCNHVRDATTTTRRCGMKGCDCDDFMPTDEPVSREGEELWHKLARIAGAQMGSIAGEPDAGAVSHDYWRFIQRTCEEAAGKLRRATHADARSEGEDGYHSLHHAVEVIVDSADLRPDMDSATMVAVSRSAVKAARRRLSDAPSGEGVGS